MIDTMTSNAPTWTAPTAPFGTGELALRPYPAALSSRTGAPMAGTAAPIAGSTPFRDRPVAAGTSGSHRIGDALKAISVQLNSTTPGELPPRDPLS